MTFRAIKRAVLLALLLWTGAQASEFRDAKSGMLFPERCDSWTRTRTETHPDGRIGTSAAYSSKLGCTVTVRVFDGHRGAPEDEASRIRDEIEEVAAGIQSVWSARGARVEIATSVQALDSDPGQYVVAHRIFQKSEQLSSITLLRYWNGRYLCFRFTTPEKDLTAAFGELGRFLAALATANPRTSKPAKVPQS